MFRHATTGKPSPVASSTGPGDVAWEASCIYTNDLAVAEKDPTDVCNLNLFSQNLTEIPPAVFTMTNLEYLNLAGNKITSVPADIGNLTHLKWLYLNQNPIASLPDSIGNLKNLQLLAAEQDDIASLPSGMTNMANLQAIIVQGNPLPPSEVTRIKATFAKASVIY
jgi:Leucine-rich repeat (LRR) protein